MVQYYDLEKAVDYLIDETSEGTPFREGKEFVCGHFVEKKADPPPPPHVRGLEVIRTGINSASEATICFRPENPDDRDCEVQADLYRLSEWQPRGLEDLRRRFALPLIVRACVEGRWKTDGKAPGSAKRKDIRARDFIGSEIDHATGDLMSTPGPTSSRPESAAAIWTELMFSVPDATPQPKRISQAPPPIEPLTARSRFPLPAGRPNRVGRERGAGSYDSKDAPLLDEIQALVENEEPMGLWDAALSVAERAPGKGSPESRAKRLVKKYKERRDRL